MSKKEILHVEYSQHYSGEYHLVSWSRRNGLSSTSACSSSRSSSVAKISRARAQMMSASLRFPVASKAIEGGHNGSVRDDPGDQKLLDHHEHTEGESQENAVLEGACKHHALVSPQVGDRHAGGDVLWRDHLAHHAARGICRSKQ